MILIAHFSSFERFHFFQFIINGNLNFCMALHAQLL